MATTYNMSTSVVHMDKPGIRGFDVVFCMPAAADEDECTWISREAFVDALSRTGSLRPTKIAVVITSDQKIIKEWNSEVTTKFIVTIAHSGSVAVLNYWNALGLVAGSLIGFLVVPGTPAGLEAVVFNAGRDTSNDKFIPLGRYFGPTSRNLETEEIKVNRDTVDDKDPRTHLRPMNVMLHT